MTVARSTGRTPAEHAAFVGMGLHHNDVDGHSSLAALVTQAERAEGMEQALVDLHESLFIASERNGLGAETCRSMAKFAKQAALAGGAA